MTKEPSMRCPKCAGDVASASRKSKVRVGRRTALVLDEFMRCGRCGFEFYAPGQVRATQVRAADQIREKHHLLAPSQIRDLRRGMEMTQREFEELIGVGPKTVVRWERGTVVPSSSTNQLLRLLMALPAAREALTSLGSAGQPEPKTYTRHEFQWNSFQTHSWQFQRSQVRSPFTRQPMSFYDRALSAFGDLQYSSFMDMSSLKKSEPLSEEDKVA